MVLVVSGGSLPAGRDCDVDGDIVCLGGISWEVDGMARLEYSTRHNV